MYTDFQDKFLDSKVESKLLLKKFFGVNDVFNLQHKPDLANSDPVSSKTNFDEVLPILKDLSLDS